MLPNAAFDSLSKEISSSHREWHLNLELLRNAYHGTRHADLQKKIEFLALNYLAKAAPESYRMRDLSPTTQNALSKLSQLGLMSGTFTYHRGAPVFESHLAKVIAPLFSKRCGSGWILTDTAEFQELFPLFFDVLENSEASLSWADRLATAFQQHVKARPDEPYSSFMESPLLLDLTSVFADVLKTHQEEEKERLFARKWVQVAKSLDRATDLAIEKIRQDARCSISTPQKEAVLKVYLKANLGCLCRCEVEGVGLLKPITFFDPPEDFQWSGDGKTTFLGVESSKEWASTLRQTVEKRFFSLYSQFVTRLGLRLGAVRGRQQVFQFIRLSQLIESVEGIKGSMKELRVETAMPNTFVRAFKNKEDLFLTPIFKEVQEQLNDKTTTPEIAFLGTTTLNLITGLLTDLPLERWKTLHADPETRHLIQHSLQRILFHLSHVKFSTQDFALFSQAIERTHYELATLLFLTFPYKEQDFRQAFRHRLQIVPEPFQDKVFVGLTRSAMSTFAGILLAVRSLQTRPNIAYVDQCYWEEEELVGEKSSTNEVLNDSTIQTVDLYVTEFNHNMTDAPEHTHYTSGDPIKDIKALLQAKKETRHLTVAMDYTIDFLNSPKAKQLLEQFIPEIRSGKLNFVFFSSGQKFEMLGLDHYYGSPFWIVNNGSPSWKAFERLTTSEAYKTDPLSLQWFCLMARHAPQAAESYKKLIFQKTRGMLSRVPLELLPGSLSKLPVRINTVDETMDPAFIDLKFSGPHFSSLLKRVHQLLYRHFAERKVPLLSRSSFGFFHVNASFLGDHSLRVTVGLATAN